MLKKYKITYIHACKFYMIRQFLIENKAEVTEMLLTEYNEEEVMELFKEEGRQNGVEEGRKEGTLYTLGSLVNRGLISVSDAAEYAGLSEEGFEKEMSLLYSAKA